MKRRTMDLVKAIEDYHNGKPIDQLVEKLLVEICAGYREGKSLGQLAEELDLSLVIIKAVIRKNAELEAKM